MNLNISGRNVFVTSDIHNDYDGFLKLLKEISFHEEDLLIIAGDLFDRGDKPVELYFEVQKHPNILVIKGNHDVWVRNKIRAEYAGEKDLKYISYNTLDLMKGRLTPVDLLNLAEWIDGLPYFINLNLDGECFQIAHAQTFPTPERILNKMQILMGDLHYENFISGKMELEKQISVVGHTPTINREIWISPTGKTIRIDCGNEMGGRLGAILLNNRELFYV